MSQEFPQGMPVYRSHKQVRALEIAGIGYPQGENARVAFKDSRFDPIECPAEMFARYTPVPGDFYVVYDNDYASFSPRKAFVEGYSLAK